MQKTFELLWSLFLERLNEESQKSSQADVARRLGVGRGNVTKWLNGTIQTADISAFSRYMDVLGINIIDVLDLKVDSDIDILIRKNEKLEQSLEKEREECMMLRGEIRLLSRRLDRYEPGPQQFQTFHVLEDDTSKVSNE